MGLQAASGDSVVGKVGSRDQTMKFQLDPAILMNRWAEANAKGGEKARGQR